MMIVLAVIFNITVTCSWFYFREFPAYPPSVFRRSAFDVVSHSRKFAFILVVYIFFHDVTFDVYGENNSSLFSSIVGTSVSQIWICSSLSPDAVGNQSVMSSVFRWTFDYFFQIVPCLNTFARTLSLGGSHVALRVKLSIELFIGSLIYDK